jgi:hypothetical protein
VYPADYRCFEGGSGFCTAPERWRGCHSPGLLTEIQSPTGNGLHALDRRGNRGRAGEQHLRFSSKERLFRRELCSERDTTGESICRFGGRGNVKSMTCVSKWTASSPLKKGTVPVGSIGLLLRIYSLERDSPNIVRLKSCCSRAAACPRNSSASGTQFAHRSNRS